MWIVMTILEHRFIERSWDHKFAGVYVAATVRLLRPIVLPVTIGSDKNMTEMCDV